MSIVKTYIYRADRAQAFQDSLTGDCYIAIGAGGHNESNEPKAPSPSQSSLVDEVARLFAKVERQGEYTVRVHAYFPLTDLADYTEISEIGVFKDDRLYAVRNSSPVIVSPDSQFDGYNAEIMFVF